MRGLEEAGASSSLLACLLGGGGVRGASTNDEILPFFLATRYKNGQIHPFSRLLQQ